MMRNSLWLSVVLIFTLLVFATAFSCTDDDDDDSGDNCVCTSAPAGVETNRTCYAEGDQAPAADGCNTCYCESGDWACTEMACVDDDSSNDDDVDEDDDDSDSGLPWLYALQGNQAGIYDALGREVILRGVNFNHLGDYFAGELSLPTNAELGAEDWDDAAALGMNVIRLVTTWSAWEPQLDDIDEDYLAKVRAAIDEANAHDMYVVIDMHQDAWSKFVFTPVDEECPEGTHHQKGWDGAPLWATFTDGEPTCTPGSREESPAVIRAWDSFYSNREGIRDELAELWGLIASEFVDHPGVAGYDLINEPGSGSGLLSTRKGLSDFYRDAIDAIRQSEAKSQSMEHIIFFEPSVHGVPPEFDLRGPGLVFAAHNYFESIVDGPEGLLDFSFLLYDMLGKTYNTTLWIGEFGSFNSQESNEEWMARFAALEDAYLWSGGTWWQWEQECGDPHNMQYPPTPAWVEEQLAHCGDARMEPTKCSKRAYPRAAPGRLLSLESKTCDGNMHMTGSTEQPGEADLWIPSQSETQPSVTGLGITATNAVKVEGGWRIVVTVDGDYSIEVSVEI
jgi:endoglycosylceramidase